METMTITNQQKYENYREQFKRLKKALDNGFNLEAMFIEYAIMEDRTESVLRHAEMWERYMKKQGNRFPTIDSKIKFIQNQALSNNKSLLHKYFSDELLEKVINWKEERNRMIHALLKQQLEHNEVFELAIKGKELSEKLRTRVGNYNRAVERQKEKNDK